MHVPNIGPRLGLAATAVGLSLIGVGYWSSSGSAPGAAPVSHTSALAKPRAASPAPAFVAVVPSGLSARSTPLETARAWLEQNPSALKGVPASSMRAEKLLKGVAGNQTIVRFQQVASGHPVLGAQAVVAVDSKSRVVAALAKTLPGPGPSSRPKVSSRAAVLAALGSVEKAPNSSASVTSKPTLEFFNPRMVGGPGLRRTSLVWAVPVATSGSKPSTSIVYVDAHRGYPIATMDTMETALNRRVCDAHSSSTNVPCSSGAALLTEHSGSTTIGDANKAFQYAGSTYDFYSGLGRDSIDGNGQRIDSTVRYCPSSAECPFDNAYWDGSQMIYGAGYASADDVVAHELTHGVTQNTSALFYYYQSGAINEGMSDVMGEFVDQSDGQGNDTPAVKWLMGEDLPGGAIRNMANPPAFGDPDTTASNSFVNYAPESTNWDSGGVHTNSGVTNKTAFLITDGGTFNGQTITGLGLAKASRIWYQTELLLTSGSDYRDLGTTLSQACRSLIGTDGIVEDDCVQVDKAGLATDLPQTPVKAAAPQAQLCDSGAPNDAYSDNFDSGKTWTSAFTIGSNHWKYGSAEPDSGHYAKSGSDNLYGSDTVERSDSTITMPTNVRVPVGGFIHFAHAFGFEQNTNGTPGSFDGGIVEYSTNNGGTWHDAGSLPSVNGYTGKIANFSGTDNPLGGHNAFVGVSDGYISTRYDLSSLAGQDVRFRFRIGTDTDTGGQGWFIDNVRVYSCGPSDTTPPDTTIGSGSGPNFPTSGATVSYSNPSFEFSSSETSATFECKIDAGAWSPCTSPESYVGLADGAHTFYVRSTDQSGNTDPTPASMPFTVLSAGPDTTLDSSPPTRVASKSVSFAFSSPDTAVTFECRLDSGAWSACSSPKSYSGLAEGGHSFLVRAVDIHGTPDSAPAGLDFEVDTIGPNTLLIGRPSAWSSSRNATFAFESPEDPVTFQCQFDNASVWSLCTSPKDYTKLAQGTHTFKVRARDALLNADLTPVTAIFVVDTVPPNTRITSGAKVTKSTRPTFRFAAIPASDGYSFSCAIDFQDAVTCKSTWRVPKALQKGTHTLWVWASDRAGNQDPSPATLKFRIK